MVLSDSEGTSISPSSDASSSLLLRISFNGCGNSDFFVLAIPQLTEGSWPNKETPVFSNREEIASPIHPQMAPSWACPISTLT